MARPEVSGLQYFSFDVDFFNDEKIQAVSAEFGIKGEMVAIRLLCAIYSKGYFIEWTDRLRFNLLRNLPGISASLLDDIVQRLVKWGFFDATLFGTAHVLTSHGIQRRYFEATRRRKNTATFQYLLLHDDAPAPDATDTPTTSFTDPPTLPGKMLDAIARRHLITPETVAARYSEFLLDCQCRATVHSGKRDLMSHFNDWLRIILLTTTSNPSNHNATNQSQPKDRRRGVEAAPATPQDYNASF